jgi:rhomboid protease GluP
VKRPLLTTYAIIAMNVIVFIVELYVGGGQGAQQVGYGAMTRMGGLSSLDLVSWQPWRIVTAMFLHYSFMHIAMNMLALYQVGTLLERRYGSTVFTIVYFLAGLAGSGASVLWQSLSHPMLSAGASGAIMGIIGAAAVSAMMVGGQQGRAIRDVMLRWAVLTIGIGFFIHSDNAAHIGGFVAGAGLAYVVEKLRWIGGRQGIGVAAVVLALIAGGSFALTYMRSVYAIPREGGVTFQKGTT